ncbi:MAG: glycosyl hydrolase 53 family protein [Ferruginibacter sp.]
MKKNNLLKLWSCVFLLCIAVSGCSKSGTPTPPPVIVPPVTPPSTSTFAKGADVSWLTQMENSGIKFYNTAGTQTELISLLKNLGMNSIRLRAWVNPTDGWNNTTDLVAKAVRANNLGMRILIDFHYSDTWADPGHQSKPAAWASQDIIALQTSVKNYTTDVMNALKTNGVTPEWVQVGNETNDGMLWPEGKASTNMVNFAKLINAGYDAVKAVSSTSKVVVHVSNGFDNGLFRWLFDGLQNNGAHWDVIGMSLYPNSTNYTSLNNQCLTNMNDMISRYNKEVMICEVGMSWDQPDACNAFLIDLIQKATSITGNKCLGIFYWEPEAYNNWQGYSLGAFDNSGKPTTALNAFK